MLTADDDYTSPDSALLNASYAIDGVAQPPSQTNVLENAVAGLRITLKGVTSSPATVTVSEPTLDRTAIKDKVKAFVDAYNAVVDTTRTALTEKPITSPSSSFQAGLGQLHGDAGLTSMLSRLRSSMTEVLAGSGLDDLSDLGITVPKASGGATSDAAQGRPARHRRHEAHRRARGRLDPGQGILRRLRRPGRGVRHDADRR